MSILNKIKDWSIWLACNILDLIRWAVCKLLKIIPCKCDHDCGCKNAHGNKSDEGI